MSIPAPSDVAEAPADATRTASGLAYKVLQAGDGGAHPSATAKVEVHYTGWMTNGQMFDSSVARGRTSSFPLNRVIAGWTEGLQLMTVGEKTRFWIPGELAYGTEPSAGGRPYGTLVFDVELFAFENPPPPPETLLVGHAGLPQPLRRFAPPGAGGVDPGPEIAFPPDGAIVEGQQLTARVQGGVAPFTWLANGAPVATSRTRQTVLDGLGPGFADLTVIDAEGRSARVSFRLD